MLDRRVESLLKPENVVMLTKMGDAYIGARCLPRRYSTGEIKGLVEGWSAPLSGGIACFHGGRLLPAVLSMLRVPGGRRFYASGWARVRG
ncbi:MAG: hypothetical protein F7C07_07075 [Desulfurococcales archaeon]|nr:hypothetical protein [Desulfurococcales archaeon]